MSPPQPFSAEDKRRLLQLLIEALAEEHRRKEEALLEVVTAPEPANASPRFDDREPRLRMTLWQCMDSGRPAPASDR